MRATCSERPSSRRCVHVPGGVEITGAADLPLPPDATGKGAEATMRRGVLELRLPKTGAAPDESIPVSDA